MLTVRISRQRREKAFGAPEGVPLDRNAKIRLMTRARGINARALSEGHRRPITRAALEILQAMLWGFHNQSSGLCFPSYEQIAHKAGCHRATVCEAIKALEACGLLTWTQRIYRQRVKEYVCGQWVIRWRVLRTSNAYRFIESIVKSSKSEIPTGTNNQDSFFKADPPPAPVFNPDDVTDQALLSLGKTFGFVS